MTWLFHLAIFGWSFVGALIPVINVEAVVIVAAQQAGPGWGSALAVALIAATGTMAGKLQVYLVARGGRSIGGRWMDRRADRERHRAMAEAERRAVADAEDEAAELATPVPGRAHQGVHALKRWLADVRDRKTGTVAVFASALLGMPPFAIVAAVAGAGRMRWHVFALAGLAGRFLRFLLVYAGVAYTLGR